MYQKFLCSSGNLYSLCQLDSLLGISSPCVPFGGQSIAMKVMGCPWAGERFVVIPKAMQNHRRAPLSRAQAQAAPELPPRTPSTSQAMPRASCPGTVEQSPAPSSPHLPSGAGGHGGIPPSLLSRSSRRISQTLGCFVKHFYISVSQCRNAVYKTNTRTGL